MVSYKVLGQDFLGQISYKYGNYQSNILSNSYYDELPEFLKEFELGRNERLEQS